MKTNTSGSVGKPDPTLNEVSADLAAEVAFKVEQQRQTEKRNLLEQASSIRDRLVKRIDGLSEARAQLKVKRSNLKELLGSINEYGDDTELTIDDLKEMIETCQVALAEKMAVDVGGVRTFIVLAPEGFHAGGVVVDPGSVRCNAR